MKKRIYERLLTILLVTTLGMSMLTGCGQKEKQEVHDTGMQETGEEMPEESTATAEEDGFTWDSAETAEEDGFTWDSAENEGNLNETPSNSDDSRGTAEQKSKQASRQESMVVDQISDTIDYEDGYKNRSFEEEEYSYFRENSFVDAREENTSTFAADVDTASYSIIRKMLKEGYHASEIPEDAVRIEEMINYFEYDLKKPQNGKPFGITVETGNCPWNNRNMLVMVGVSTEKVDLSEDVPSNLVFLLDVSGSMCDEDKLPLLQQSFGMLAEQLTEKDRVSIVTYADGDQVVLEGARGNETAKIMRALNNLEAGGSTNGGAGIQRAYKLAEDNYVEGGNNRVILATDGDLNVGITSGKELEELITEKKKGGVFLSVLGFGTENIKDNKMELLADKGNGNYSYIDSVKEGRKVFVEELGATLKTVAKDVKLQMEFDDKYVKSYRLIGYDNRVMNNEDFTDDRKDGGEIGAGHSVVAFYEVEPANEFSKTYREDRSNMLGGKKFATLRIRYKEPEGTRSMEVSGDITGTKSINASDDFIFASCVAEFGLLLKNSEYKENADYESILSRLDKLEKDDYKTELEKLVYFASDNYMYD